jgi:hypothetical protein
MPTKLNDAGELVSVPQAGQMWRVYPNRYQQPDNAIVPTDEDRSSGFRTDGYQTMVSWEAARDYLAAGPRSRRDTWQAILDGIMALTPPDNPTNQAPDGSAVSACGRTGDQG